MPHALRRGGKLAKDGDRATYRFGGHAFGGHAFGDPEATGGEFTVSRRTGEVRLAARLRGEAGDALFQRVAYQVIRQWREGVLPEQVVWTS